MKPRSSESGSVLYFVFIGIALFVALNLAVMQMNRGGGENMKDELYRLHAGEVLDYGRALRTAVQTMKIAGVPETQISFENNIVAGYGNGNCTAAGCRIFDQSGGGISYHAPADAWLDPSHTAEAAFGTWWFSGANDLAGIGTDGNGAASRELMAVLPWISRAVCLEINNLLEIANPGGNPPKDATDVEMATRFTGTYTDGDTIGGVPGIDGHRAGCFEGDNDPPAGTYHFYQVLLPR